MRSTCVCCEYNAKQPVGGYSGSRWLDNSTTQGLLSESVVMADAWTLNNFVPCIPRFKPASFKVHNSTWQGWLAGCSWAVSQQKEFYDTRDCRVETYASHARLNRGGTQILQRLEGAQVQAFAMPHPLGADNSCTAPLCLRQHDANRCLTMRMPGPALGRLGSPHHDGAPCAHSLLLLLQPL